AALLGEERDRLLDVDVLAGGAGEHGHQGVPVVGRGDDDGVHVAVVEELAEVGVLADAAADEGGPLVEAALMRPGEGGDPGVLALQEGEGVPLADETEADETDAEAAAGAEGGGGGERQLAAGEGGTGHEGESKRTGREVNDIPPEYGRPRPAAREPFDLAP